MQNRCWWLRQLHCSQWILLSSFGCFGRLLLARLAGSRICQKKLNTQGYDHWSINHLAGSCICTQIESWTLRNDTRPVCHTDVRNISSSYVVGSHTLCSVVWSQPVLKTKIIFGFLIFLCVPSAPVSHHGWIHSLGKSSWRAHTGRCWRAWRSELQCCTPPSEAPEPDVSDILC